MQPWFETVTIPRDRSWLLFDRQLPDFPFNWHYHPEFELTLTVGSCGVRFVGDHVERYAHDDLVLLGPNLPHAWQSEALVGDAPLHRAIVCWFTRDWIEGLTDLRIATSFGSGRLSCELVLTLLKDGSYRRHMESVRAKLSHAMGETTERLAALGITPWMEQRAGMFAWCRLPEANDVTDLARRALAQNVVLAPGNAFSLSQTAGNFLRFNVAQCADERIFKVLETLMTKPAATRAASG